MSRWTLPTGTAVPEVPAGVFCGVCGAHLTPQPGDGPQWLRPKVFCAAPDEHVLRPSIASSLFPHLSQVSRTPFNLGLVLVLAAIAASGEVKLPGALVTVAALGLPLLFLIYPAPVRHLPPTSPKHAARSPPPRWASHSGWAGC